MFEVFAHLVSMAPLALHVLLYYINMGLEDRQARQSRQPIQECDNELQYMVPQQPCDDG